MFTGPTQDPSTNTPELTETVRPSPDPFVGRGAELAVIREAITAATQGSGRIILIGGEAGIGKTRLAQEAAAEAESRGLKVLWGRCWEGSGAPAFWPWVQILRGYAPEIAADPGIRDLEIATIAHGIPELRDIVTCSPSSPQRTTDDSRFQFFYALSQLIERMTRSHPAMLILDDLHWGDQSSLLILKLLGPSIKQLPVALLVAYRDSDTSSSSAVIDILSHLTTERHSRRLFLDRLHKRDIAGYLHALIGRSEAPIIDAIFSRSSGHPLFLRELVDLLRRTDLLSAASAPSIATVFPQSAREAILQRLHRLPTTSVKLLATAALFGQEFEVSLLASTLDLAPAELCARLEQALRARVIEELPRSRYRFTHILTRDALHDLLPIATRALLHRQIAAAIERATTLPIGTTLPLLAYHHTEALIAGDPPARAVEYLRKAGAYFCEHLAFEEAGLYFLRALELGATCLGPEERCDTLLALGEAQTFAGKWSDARVTLRMAVNEARDLPTPDRFCQAVIGFRGIPTSTVPPDESTIRLLREALLRLDESRPRLRVEVESALASALHFAGATDHMRAHADSAYATASSLNDSALLGTALSAHLLCNLDAVHTKDLRRYSYDLLTIANTLQDNNLAFRAQLGLRASLLTLGDLSGSRQALRDLKVIHDTTRHPRHLWYYEVLRFASLMSAARFDEAAAHCDYTSSIGERYIGTQQVQFSIIQRFELSRTKGDFTQWLTYYPDRSDIDLDICAYRAGFAVVLASLDRVHQALELIEPLASGDFRQIPLDSAYLWTLAVLTDVCAEHGPTEWQELLYSLLLPFTHHGVLFSWGILYDGSADHYLGVLAGKLGRWAESEVHFRDAITINLRMQTPALVARSRFRLAEMLLKRRQGTDPEEAQTLLAKCLRTFVDLGMDGYSKLAQQLVCSAVGPQREDAEALRLPASHPDSGMFRYEGYYWTIVFRGIATQIPNCRGNQYLAYLLMQSDVDRHVLDLVAAARGNAIDPLASPLQGDSQGQFPDQSIELCDDRARVNYKRRLEAIDESLEEAREFNDPGRTEALLDERNQIIRELSRAYGLGGRSRPSGSTTERARISVRNSITNALKAIRPRHPPLWRHLTASVRTGVYCSYRPEEPVCWEVSRMPQWNPPKE